MNSLRPLCAVMALVCASPAAQAEGSDIASFNLLRAAELPAHRSLMARVTSEDGEVSDFTTDGCSGGMSAGWALIAEEFPDLALTSDTSLPWVECCVVHDRAYHAAGGATEAEDSYDQRLRADETLRACVIETGAARMSEVTQRFGLSEAQAELVYRLLASSMYNAVRLGGAPCSGLPWRWGYGYPKC